MSKRKGKTIVIQLSNSEYEAITKASIRLDVSLSRFCLTAAMWFTDDLRVREEEAIMRSYNAVRNPMGLSFISLREIADIQKELKKSERPVTIPKSVGRPPLKPKDPPQAL